MGLRFVIHTLTRASIALILTGCSAIAQQLENLDQASITRLLTQEIPTTETPMPALAANLAVTGIIPVTGYTHGSIEMRTPDLLNASGGDCVNFFFFAINSSRALSGNGSVDCHFESPSSVGTVHVVLRHTVRVSGVIRKEDDGSDRLLVQLTFNGRLLHYFTDTPQGAFIPYTEAHPFVLEDNGPINLNFDCVDGTKVYDTRSNPMAGRGSAPGENRRTFILHLE